MLTNALESIVFLSVLMWPFTLPVFLLLLAYLPFLLTDMVKNWEKRSVRRTAGAVGLCVLLLVAALVRESMPYSVSSAKCLYRSHRTAYDTVAAFMLEQAETDGRRTSYWTSDREKWPEEIEKELGKVLGNWSLRCGSPHAGISTLGWGGEPAVLFAIYFGPEYDSGDGGPARDIQYLAYCPDVDPSRAKNSYRESLIHLTGVWYLYREVNM